MLAPFWVVRIFGRRTDRVRWGGRSCGGVTPDFDRDGDAGVEFVWTGRTTYDIQTVGEPVVLTRIPAYVYPNIHMHFPPLPYSYTFIAIFICIVCVMFYICTYVLVYFLLFPNLNRHLYHGVYWYNHTPTFILSLWFLLYFHFVICTSTMIPSLCLPWFSKQVNFTMT